VGRELLSSKCSQVCQRMQERAPWAGQWVFIDIPLRIEPLGTWKCCSRADRTCWSRGPDARSTTGRTGPVTDRTRWSSLSSTPTKQWPDALLDESDATVPASGQSPVSTQNDRTCPVDYDRTCYYVRSEDQHARKHWAVTGCVRSNRDRVRSPLWPPFASVWFTLSHKS
jgi:hypothetical protein